MWIILGQTDRHRCGDSYTAINFVYRGIITDRMNMYIKQSRFHGNSFSSPIKDALDYAAFL